MGFREIGFGKLNLRKLYLLLKIDSREIEFRILDPNSQNLDSKWEPIRGVLSVLGGPIKQYFWGPLIVSRAPYGLEPPPKPHKKNRDLVFRIYSPVLLPQILIDLREARKKIFDCFFILLVLSGFFFEMLKHPPFEWDTYHQIILHEARKNIFDFFHTFEWIFFWNVKKLSIWMIHSSPNETARSAKETFWLFFHTFEWIFLWNIKKPSIWVRHLSPNETARSAKENFWLVSYFWVDFSLKY